MPSGQKLHKAGPLTVALFYSNLRGDPSVDSDYTTDTQHNSSDSSSDCGSNTSGDEYIIAEGHATEARAAEAHAAEACAAKVHAAKAHTAEACAAKVCVAEVRAAKALAADFEGCSDKEDAADEEGGLRVSDKGCASPFYDKWPLFNSLHAQGRIFC